MTQSAFQSSQRTRAEAAERKLATAIGKLRDIRSNATVNHPDPKWLIEFIHDYADKALIQLDFQTHEGI